MKTLYLTYPHLSAQHAGSDYLVVQVDHDTSIKPGAMLSEEKVKDLCEQTGIWKVQIKLNKQS